MKQEKEPAAPASGLQFKNVKEIESNTRTRMDKVLVDLQHEMTTIRTGRASIALLDNVRVDYYGTPTPLNQVAQLHVPEPAMITVQPWDTSTIRAIEKAIREADLGFNPSNDGKIVRVPVPPLTEERRRNIRRDSNEHLKKLLKEKLISEDEERQALDLIQKLTDGQITKVDQASKAKEKEILEFK
jgi:ribosome recycling factor